VPLNQDALVFGACVAIVILLLVELLFALVRFTRKKLSHPTNTSTPAQA
jgi:hypothetical protein